MSKDRHSKVARVKIAPRHGLIVRDPATRRPLAKEGEERELTGYWRRRLLCGDVLIVKPHVAPAPKAERKEQK